MPMSRESRGLCGVCKNDPTCVFPKDRTRPLLQCEQFEAFTITPVMAVRQDQPPVGDTWFGSRAEERGPSDYLGLCSNCKVRRTCIYPQPEGGIWRCEMYQ